MPEYTPVFEPGRNRTLRAGAAIVGGRLLAVSAANTVTETSAATAAWVGVATTDMVSGGDIGITSGGVQEVTAAATIAPGDTLIPAAAGRVTPIGAGTNYAQVVGVALTGAAAGAAVRVQFAR